MHEYHTHPFSYWLATLAVAATAELVHLALVNPEGTAIGDAAFAWLANRQGVRGAQASIDAEQSVREQERLDWSGEAPSASKIEN